MYMSLRQPRNFNPRPLAGATSSSSRGQPPPAYFNPRPLAGATLKQFLPTPVSLISIHAPSRGRRAMPLAPRVFMIFQSTPPRGGDDSRGSPSSLYPDFNPRPLAGATSACSSMHRSKPFQSTPPRGGDGVSSTLRLASSISIHAPSRGRQVAKSLTISPARFQSTPPRGGDHPHS